MDGGAAEAEAVQQEQQQQQELLDRSTSYGVEREQEWSRSGRCELESSRRRKN